jgi:hypothetical protein
LSHTYLWSSLVSVNSRVKSLLYSCSPGIQLTRCPLPTHNHSFSNLCNVMWQCNGSLQLPQNRSWASFRWYIIYVHNEMYLVKNNSLKMFEIMLYSYLEILCESSEAFYIKIVYYLPPSFHFHVPN